MKAYELNWGQRIILAVAGAILLSMGAGCSVPLTPDVIQALAADNASVCGRAGVRGGAGAMPLAGAAVPIGGYGSTEIAFCRSNTEKAVVSMSPDGTISIKHGD